MSKVYVTQERPGFNYLDAERFGEIKFITHRDYTMPHTADNNKLLREDIRIAVNEYDPDQDYILLSGSPLVAGVVIGKIVRKYDPEVVKVVKWDNRRSEYTVVTAYI
jgi:hypothetical protein